MTNTDVAEIVAPADLSMSPPCSGIKFAGHPEHDEDCFEDATWARTTSHCSRQTSLKCDNHMRAIRSYGKWSCNHCGVTCLDQEDQWRRL